MSKPETNKNNDPEKGLHTEISRRGFLSRIGAVSAGALIAISCDKIVMVPGSSIGAATVVDQTGEKQSEKYQSYMRSEMRSTAERNGRRTDIAQGMVDETFVIEGLVDSTQLVTLTSKEAYKYEIADTLLENIDEVLKYFDLESAESVVERSNWAEDVVRFLNNPIISSILIMIGFFGLFAEIKSPGWGVPGTAGLLALTLFFGSSYILQLASIVEILMFIIGLGLILIEVFAIPGFGIAGISGILLIIASLFLALVGADPFIDMEAVSMAIIQLTVALVLSIILIIVLAKFLPRTTIFKKFVLSVEEKSEAGFVSHTTSEDMVGKMGKAITDLRPAGTAEIDGERVDVVTDSEFIEKGSSLEVVEVEGIRVVVREIKAAPDENNKA